MRVRDKLYYLSVGLVLSDFLDRFIKRDYKQAAIGGALIGLCVAVEFIRTCRKAGGA